MASRTRFTVAALRHKTSCQQTRNMRRALGERAWTVELLRLQPRVRPHSRHQLAEQVVLDVVCVTVVVTLGLKLCHQSFQLLFDTG